MIIVDTTVWIDFLESRETVFDLHLKELIERETENAKAGKRARIPAKINRLADREIVNKLYEASQAGVEIDLIIRGICTLRPGVPGLSENIRVRSIVGRLLEHSRVYHFENGGDPEVYIGSSDWMPRNLDRRVELIVPVTDPEHRVRLGRILDTLFADNVKARELRSDGSLVKRDGRRKAFRAQEIFWEEARERATLPPRLSDPDRGAFQPLRRAPEAG